MVLLSINAIYLDSGWMYRGYILRLVNSLPGR